MSQALSVGLGPPFAFQPTQKRSISEWWSQKIGSNPAVTVDCIQPVPEICWSPEPTSTCTAPCGRPSSVGLKPGVVVLSYCVALYAWL